MADLARRVGGYTHVTVLFGGYWGYFLGGGYRSVL